MEVKESVFTLISSFFTFGTDSHTSLHQCSGNISSILFLKISENLEDMLFLVLKCIVISLAGSNSQLHYIASPVMTW